MSATNFSLGKQRVADLVARSALRIPVLERMLAMGCRQPLLRKLGLGAVAHGYSRILRQRELRIADFGDYRLWVNVAELLGIEPFFFGRSGAVWLASSLVREGDVCIDAGANVGHYTFLMASIVQKHGRVFAFEANPAMVEVLGRSITLNDYRARVEVIPLALWSVPNEEMKFFVSVESSNSGTSSLVDHGWFLSEANTIRVITTTLDEFASKRSIEHLRLVKLDVERAEDQVLRGTQRLLREAKIDYLIVELVAGTEAQRILAEHGYEGYFLDVPERRLIPLSAVSTGTFCDALFVSPTLHAEFIENFSKSIELDTIPKQ